MSSAVGIGKSYQLYPGGFRGKIGLLRNSDNPPGHCLRQKHQTPAWVSLKFRLIPVLLKESTSEVDFLTGLHCDSNSNDRFIVMLGDFIPHFTCKFLLPQRVAHCSTTE